MLKVDAKKWWHNATVYQVYLRSFKDSNGDGIGDLVGLREELGYIARLGCDALWINPCYKSPQRDHGYDISDYRSIDPVYGSTSDFCSLIEDAHDLGLKVVMDIVPNHCSSEHPWFKAALENATGARERFIFREGSGGGAEIKLRTRGRAYSVVVRGRRWMMGNGTFMHSIQNNLILIGEIQL